MSFDAILVLFELMVLLGVVVMRWSAIRVSLEAVVGGIVVMVVEEHLVRLYVTAL
jgi:hypothetical protein